MMWRIVVADDPRCNTGGVNGSQRCRRCLISPHALPFKMNPSAGVGTLEQEVGLIENISQTVI